MLSDPEERKRLRQERAEQRARSQSKMLRLRLIGAAVVLLACGVLIFSLSGKSQTRTPLKAQPQPRKPSSRQLRKPQPRLPPPFTIQRLGT